MTDAAIAVEGLSVRDGHGNLMLDSVSFAVPPKAALTLIGESGSGKSLIAHAIFGLLPSGFQVEGSITFSGRSPIDARDTGTLARAWRRDAMLVPQEPSLALDPTMRLCRQMTLSGLPQNDVPRLLSAVGLAPSAAALYPFEMSGGMAQRALVATALGVDAPLVVADEPTKGLDPNRVGQAITVLRKLMADGRAIIVVTHDRTVPRAIGGLVAVVHEGRLVEQGEAPHVLAAPQSAPARAWLAADPANWPKSECTCDTETIALAAHNVAFGWPGRPLLFNGLDIHVRRGEVVAVTGPSGCGKSTLGSILLGLVKPNSGQVTWAGRDIAAPGKIRSLRQRYQKLHQDPIGTFIPSVQLRRQFQLLSSVKSDLRPDLALPPLMDLLKLRSDLLDRMPHEVSGGEAQRLALARILLLEPDVIVADEPTSRLDPIIQRQTMELLRVVVDSRRVGLVLISHDDALVRAVADRRVQIAPQ